MSRLRGFLAQHRAATFIVITFALTWGYEFAVVYPMAGGVNVLDGAPVEVMLAIGAAMFFPGLGVVLTRLITKEGFKHCLIKPYPWRKSLPWFAVAWFGPAALIAVGAAIYYLVFPGSFDPIASRFAQILQEQMSAAGAPTELPAPVGALVIGQIVFGVLLGPAVNILTTFGEEWGWRGYLMPKMASRMRIVPTMLATGIVWGLWHAPITALGHNYGLGYAGWPFAGIAAMCVFCTAVGTIFSYVTIRTGSCLAAAFGHGSVNALAAAPTLFAAAGTNPFVGPAPTGIIGGCGFILVAVLMLIDLHRKEQRGELVVP